MPRSSDLSKMIFVPKTSCLAPASMAGALGLLSTDFVACKKNRLLYKSSNWYAQVRRPEQEEVNELIR